MGYLYRAIIGAVTLGALSLTSAYAQGSSSACKLLQPSEIESAVGGKAKGFSGSAVGETSICAGQVGTSKVVIRIAQRKRNDGGAVEKAGVEKLRKAGWRFEIKTEGDLTCSTAIPPASSAQIGFNTTCSVLRAGKVVAVEVAAPSEKEMASMEATRTLVQKAVARL
jgi:hypothetical protein